MRVRVDAGPRGRKRLRRDARARMTPRPAPSPPPEKIPRVARVLALAHHWQGLIRSGAVRDQAELARLVGVSRARVTQVMNLLWLAPGIQEDVLLGIAERAEAGLRRLAAEPIWRRQRGAGPLPRQRKH
jgi:hypothetical protein